MTLNASSKAIWNFSKTIRLVPRKKSPQSFSQYQGVSSGQHPIAGIVSSMLLRVLTSSRAYGAFVRPTFRIYSVHSCAQPSRSLSRLPTLAQVDTVGFCRDFVDFAGDC